MNMTGDKIGKISHGRNIKRFDEDAGISYSNTFNDHSVSHVIGNYGTYNFNPIDKWVGALDEDKNYISVYCNPNRKK